MYGVKLPYVITGCGGGAGGELDPPSCKRGIIFLVSLALSVTIYRYFQSNGAVNVEVENFYILAH